TTTHTWTDQWSFQTHSVSGANFRAAVSAPPDFTLNTSPSSRTVVPGGATSYSVTINPTSGFAGQVSLSVSGLPSDAGGSFAPTPATASSTLSVTTSTTTPPGTYTLTITGTSGTLTRTTTAALVVSTPDFTVSASPSSQPVVPRGAPSFPARRSSALGFAGQVSLSVSGLPSGANGSFAPTPATASSTLSVTTSASTPPG